MPSFFNAFKEGHPHEDSLLGGNMRDCVVIKWGGSLITDKEKMCTPDNETIDSLSGVMRQCLDDGLDIILVHGAGSFGHLRAKHWRLNEGLLPAESFTSQDDCNSQKEAVSIVRNEMLTLNNYVSESLSRFQLVPSIKPPHEWAKNTGSSFDGDISKTFSDYQDSICVTFGDVVDCEGEMSFGILSGDDLVVRLCEEIPNVKRLVFAVGGVDGILKRPPEFANSGDLIKNWSPGMKFEGLHNTEIDVTGGIGLKAARGAEVAKLGIEVLIVNGSYPERVFDACTGKEVLGTIISA
jgi:isopentenyl phosphate kinase